MKTFKTHFALTSVIAMLVLTVSIHAQAENIIGKNAKQSTAVGGGDTGGGNTLAVARILNEDDFKKMIKNAQISLSGVFRAFEMLVPGSVRFNPNENEITSIEDMRKISQELAETIYKDGEVYSLIKSLKFVPQEAPCLDRKGKKNEASIYNMPQDTVCISTGMLLEAYKAGRLNNQNVFVEIVALMAHEVVHKAGYAEDDEIMPTLIQESTRLELSSSTIMTQVGFNTDPDELRIGHVYNSYRFGLELSYTHSLLAVSIDESDFDIQCEISTQLVSTLDKALDDLRRKNSIYFVVYNASEYRALKAAYLLTKQAGMTYCKSPAVLKRIQEGGQWVGSLILPDNSYTDPQFRHIPFRDVEYRNRAQYALQLEEALKQLNFRSKH